MGVLSSLLMVRLRLELEEEVRMQLLGLQSSWPEHKLVWSINKQLGLHLTRQEDFEIELNQGDTSNTLFESDSKYYYSVFYHEGEQEQAILVANLNKGMALYDRKRKLDFLLRIESNVRTLSECSQTLNQIRGVLAVTKIDCSAEEPAARVFEDYL